MSLWKIAWRSMQQRALASWLTGLSMALGVALVVAVLVIHSVVDETFRRTAQGYDLIVGAKGGGLQLVLNTVFHLSRPINNIPYSYYKEFTEDENHRGKYARYVKLAIPYCLGDNYEGYRVVGTTPRMFDEFEYAKGRKYEFAQGRNFKQDKFFEGVIGSLVAAQTTRTEKMSATKGAVRSTAAGFRAEESAKPRSCLRSRKATSMAQRWA